MDSRVSATEAARRFSDLVNRVRYRGERFVVERAGEPVCRIEPAMAGRRTVVDLLRPVDPGFAKAVRQASRRQGRPPGDRWA
jgi:prevent-host-death family protein